MCRACKGPVMIEAKTYRHGGHHVNDPGLYMPKDKLEYYKDHDPLKIAREHLLNHSDCTEQDVVEMEEQVNQGMYEAVEFAKKSHYPAADDFLEEVKQY
jgi:TPP-dependent pyruvate/acetoin dehydrogenase alpha subunit